MPVLRIATLIISLALVSGPGYSQSITVATTGNGTAIYFYGLAVAKAAREIEGLDLRPKPYTSAGQGAVFVNRGEDDFGLFNAIVLREAYEGRAFYEGRALENLRLVARLVPFQITFGASGASGISSVEDLQGKRFPTGFDATAFGDRLYVAMLATGGLTPDDVVPVRVSDWAALGKAFVRGDIDVNGMVIGSATVEKYAQQVDGYHAVSLGASAEAEARLHDLFPDSRLVTLDPEDGLTGVLQPVVVMEYDYWIYAHKDTADTAVTGILESLIAGGEVLTSVSADFRAFDPAAMYQDIGIPFHPAAAAFFTANGYQ
ncbi:MAG TPA: hypothetical protein DIU07_15240 [Rhodobacteraceae bacterium]|nr:hypothetical protein [Paracoccaceae bacterium]